jgi:CubicO group peptidase (beta-lactamase class C family)
MTLQAPADSGRPKDSTLRVMPDGRRIHGFVDDGYGPVMDAFVANFLERRDLGSGCTAYAGGRAVVDLWGGLADVRADRHWDRDTAAVTFSCTKGVLAICVYRLVEEGRLDLDARIAAYWPEFGENGKGHVTIRQAMSHRAGVPSLDVDLTKDEVIAWDPVIRGIEAQRPLHPPASGFIYHALTYGWIVGEVIRRVSGLTPGRYFRESIADHLELRTWIGLPDWARPSVAWMEPPLPDEDSDAARASARLASDDPVIARSVSMGGAFAFPADDAYVTFNDPAIQTAEIPGANGISTAGSLARLYAACVAEMGGPPLLSANSIDDALRVRSAGPQLTGPPDDGARWGTGFQLSSPPSQPMLGPASFGHAGAGGQLGFADAEYGVGFAYLSNQMGGYGDARARELTVALRTALRGRARPGN